ncbi:MAG TPA: hypothetical protein VK588_02765 [Chitinophagaceae bacterium]|nr:hypothetical protein [Chitinophagaceae bacterium]
MKQNAKPKQPLKKDPGAVQETLKERVHRHLSDINSEITDDDIRSVRTELEIRSEGNAEVIPGINKEEGNMAEINPKEKAEKETYAKSKKKTRGNEDKKRNK